MDAALDRQTLELAEERLSVRRVKADWTRVVVRSETVEREETATAELDRADVTVTRVPVGREVDRAPEVRVEGDVTILPVVEERLVLVRQLVLTEEIHVRRERRPETVTLPVTLQQQRAIIEHFDAATGTLLSQQPPAEKDTGHD